MSVTPGPRIPRSFLSRPRREETLALLALPRESHETRQRSGLSGRRANSWRQCTRNFSFFLFFLFDRREDDGTTRCLQLIIPLVVRLSTVVCPLVKHMYREFPYNHRCFTLAGVNSCLHKYRPHESRWSTCKPDGVYGRVQDRGVISWKTILLNCEGY